MFCSEYLSRARVGELPRAPYLPTRQGLPSTTTSLEPVMEAGMSMARLQVILWTSRTSTVLTTLNSRSGLAVTPPATITLVRPPSVNLTQAWFIRPTWSGVTARELSWEELSVEEIHRWPTKS